MKLYLRFLPLLLLWADVAGGETNVTGSARARLNFGNAHFNARRFQLTINVPLKPAPVCTNGCANGGTCTGPEQCTCAAGWSGQSSASGTGCSTPTCMPACVNGACTGPNNCTCDAGWYDVACDGTAPQKSYRVQLLDDGNFGSFAAIKSECEERPGQRLAILENAQEFLMIQRFLVGLDRSEGNDHWFGLEIVSGARVWINGVPFNLSWYDGTTVLKSATTLTAATTYMEIELVSGTYLIDVASSSTQLGVCEITPQPAYVRCVNTSAEGTVTCRYNGNGCYANGEFQHPVMTFYPSASACQTATKTFFRVSPGTTVNRVTAIRRCGWQGGQIAMLDGANDLASLTTFILDDFPTIASENFWIGARRPNAAAAFVWHTNQVVVNENLEWSPSEPITTNHCLGIRYNSTQLVVTTLPCGGSFHIICETY